MECQNSGGFDSPDCNNEGADNDRRKGRTAGLSRNDSEHLQGRNRED